MYISRLSWKTQPKLGLSFCMFYTQKSFQVHISIHFKITTKVINLSLARPPRLSPMSPKAWPRFTPLPSNLHRILTEFIAQWILTDIAQWILTEYRSMNSTTLKGLKVKKRDRGNWKLVTLHYIGLFALHIGEAWCFLSRMFCSFSI